MGLTKLNLPPDQAGYAVTDGQEVVSTELDGGMGRYRKDVAGSSSRINVQWRLTPLYFRYLKTFFNLLVEKGAQGFLLDLYLDREELTEHECHFIPGSFRLTGQRGEQFTVAAQLEAKPIRLTEEEETEEINWAVLFGELGEDFETLFPPIEADFDQIITFDLPEVLGSYPYPPLIGEAIQWLDGTTDGLTFVDKVDPQIVDSPAVTDVNCLSYDLTNNDSFQHPLSGAEYPVILEGSFKSSYVGADRMVIDGIQDSANINRYWGLTVRQSDNVVGVVVRSDDTQAISNNVASIQLFDGGWHSYRFEILSDNRYRVLIDGKVEFESTLITTAPLTSTVDIRCVGKINRGGTTDYLPFTGKTSNHRYSHGHGETDLWIGWGQSNMKGLPSTFGDLPASLQGNQANNWWYDVDDNTTRWTGSNEWLAPISPSVWGVELTAIDTIYKKSRSSLSIVKVCRSGAGLETGGWKSGGSMMTRLEDALTQAKADIIARGQTIGKVFSIPMVGESDSTNQTAADNYLTNMDQVHADIETALGQSIDHVIIPRLGLIPSTQPTWVYWDQIVADQTTIGGRAGNTSFSTDAQPRHPDDVHYTNAALISIGGQIGNIILSEIPQEYLLLHPVAEGEGLPYDCSGNGVNAIENKATWSRDGGIASLNLACGFVPRSPFNGADDTINLSSILPATRNNVTIQFILYSSDINQFNMAHGLEGDAGKYIGLGVPSNTSTLVVNGAGTPSTDIDGTTYPYNTLTRGELHSALTDGQRHVVTFANVDMSTWTDLLLFEYPAASFFMGNQCESIKIDWESSGTWGVCIISNGSNGMIDTNSGTIFTNLGTGDLSPNFSTGLYQWDGENIIPSNTVDSRNGNSLTNLGGYTYNGAECSLLWDDFDVVDSMIGTFNGVDRKMSFQGVSDGKGFWLWEDNPGGSGLSLGVEWVTGIGWVATSHLGYFTNPATTTFPPKSGWVLQSGSGTFSLDYESPWVENGEFVPFDAAKWYAHDNGKDGVWVLWDKIGGVWHVKEVYTLPLGTVLTVSQRWQAERYFGVGPSGVFA